MVWLMRSIARKASSRGDGGDDEHFLDRTYWHGRPVPPMPSYESFLAEEAARQEKNQRQDTASTMDDDDDAASSFLLEVDGDAASCLSEISGPGSFALLSPEEAWRARRAMSMPVPP